ncbi:trypsin-like serine protease [Homoserinimonas sp. OAct 916]|uniref:trypsin-like serine protease n=1 Tax=Homoserinimonas sp. OAct 916 TaxID=2211450 RepID=UPI000DBE3929
MFASSAVAQTGYYICRFGHTGGYACGTVAGSNYIANITLPSEPGGGIRQVGPLACVTAVQNGGQSQPGDSGGPWFLNNTAYGIHSAGDGSTISCFSQVNNALSRFGLKLWAG